MINLVDKENLNSVSIDDLIDNPDFAIEVLNKLKIARDENQHLNRIIAIREQQLAELNPKKTYYDVVLNCPHLVTTTTLAKDFGLNAKQLNDFLQEKDIQTEKHGILLLNRKYVERGYTRTKIGSSGDSQKMKIRIYWTQKGRLFIYGLLKQYEIYPLIERNSFDD